MAIVRQSPPTAKGMVFITLEDEAGFINVAVRPNDYARLRKIITDEPFFLAEGKLQRDGLATSVLVFRAWPLNGAFPNLDRVPDMARNFY